MSTDVFKITVKIAARTIQLNIPRAEEEKFRNAARRLNNLIAFYREKYAEIAENDNELILLMSAFHLGVDFFGESERKDIFPLLEKIANLGSEIDEHLDLSK